MNLILSITSNGQIEQITNMHKVIFNPFTHNLQFVRKSGDTTIVSGESITECQNNREYIVDSPQAEEFILPRFSSHNDFIKIYGRNDFGWTLFIPENIKVMIPNTESILNSKHYIKSEKHQYDFIHLVYSKSLWIIENYSRNIVVVEK